MNVVSGFGMFGDGWGPGRRLEGLGKVLHEVIRIELWPDE